MKLSTWCYLVAASALAAPASYAIDGLQAYRQGHYTSAAKTLIKLASTEPVANFYLGTMRLYGYGTLKNNTLALRYFTQAGHAGLADAQYLLARYYLTVANEPNVALFWFKKAADNNLVNAQMYLAGAYLFGYGVKQDGDIAKKYYIDAAKNGNDIAQYTLALHFLDGRNKQNKALGLRWLQKAAAQNNVDAEIKLSELYTKSNVVTSDTSKAQAWLVQAALNGSLDAQKSLIDQHKNGHYFSSDNRLIEQWQQHVLAHSNDVKPASKKITLSRWLSRGKDDDFNAYQLGGIYNDWHNLLTVRENKYNQSPQMHSVNRQQLYQPAFVMQNPANVPINDYFTLLAPKILKQTDQGWSFPQYPLITEIEQLQLIGTNVLSYQQQSIMPTYTRFSSKDSNLWDYFDQQSSNVMQQENYQFILSELHGQAILGNAGAQFELGQLYQYGIGVEQNITQALNYYQLAAAQQELRAEYNMAVLYLQAKTTPVNYQKGMLWMTDAAFKGNAYALYALANIYQQGLNQDNGEQIVAVNNDQSLAMYYLSAASQYGLAQYRLANYLAKNNHHQSKAAARKNNQQVKQLYQQAVANGVVEARLPLAFYYALDRSIAHKNTAFAIAFEQAKSGDKMASLLLALLYERGIATPKNQIKAAYWYQKAGKNPVSDFVLGTYNCENKALTDNQHQCEQLLMQAADAGFDWANYNLAIVRHQRGGNFLMPLKHAARAGNTKANLLLADYYLLQAKNPNAMAQSRAIYQRLAEQDDKNAQTKLAFLYDRGLGGPVDIERAVFWYQRAAAQQQSTAQFLLGQLHQLGRIDGRPNYDLAKKWYKQAQEKNTNATLALGFIYDTVDDDYQQAVTCYQRAANQNDVLALFNLGLIYEAGKGVEVDYIKAQAYYKKAALSGYPQAMTAVANLYLLGLGAAVNEQQALYWYTKSAHLNDSNAFYQLGILAETSLTAQHNLDDAVNFYQHAANLGHEKAKLALARIYHFGLNGHADMQRAASIYLDLANSDDATAQFQLALLYLDGTLGSNQQAYASKLLQRAYDNGSKQAYQTLLWLKASQGEHTSFIEAVNFNINQHGLMSPTQSAENMYVDALTEWNQGNNDGSKLILNRLIKQFPQYEPAKKAYQQLNAYQPVNSKVS